MSIPRTSINRPISVTMLMLGMALIGFGAFLTFNVALFPNIDIPVAFVQAPYPGVDPAEIEPSSPKSSKTKSTRSKISIKSNHTQPKAIRRP